MRSSISVLALGFLLSLSSAAVLPAKSADATPAASNNVSIAQLLRGTGIRNMRAGQLNALIRNLQAAGVCANAAAGEGQAEVGAGGEGEEGEGNEKELAGEFGVAVAVEGGDLKQDILFTKSAVGAFEFEFQAADADEVTVTENKTPAAPPTGFEAIEPSSFQVALAKSKGVGLTLSKIDYIFDTASAALEGKDITKAQVGRLCPDTGAFVISETLGELEFELEENEVTLNLNKNVTAEGEWGIFLPIAAAAA